MTEKLFKIGARAFYVQSEKTLSDAELVLLSDSDGIKLIRVEMRFADKNNPGDVKIFWDEPLSGITGFWSPCRNRALYIPQGWYPQRVYSTLTDGIPLGSLFTDTAGNYRTFALSEAERPFELAVWLRNDPGKDTLRIQFHCFKNEAPGVDSFSFMLRIDERSVPLAESVSDVSRWWQTYYKPDPRSYSENFAGDKPLFSSWYACFQNPTQEVLERELPVIAELGFRSLIIDDGWSYDGAGDGAYSYCGAWKVSKQKFPDMTSFVEKAHACGIKVALWFPLPFVGKRNPDYEIFKDKMLAETMGAGVLDPRCPEVREYIVGSYVKILKQYGLDGLKLDFLTDFNRPAPDDGRMTDCNTVNEGVEKLLAAIEKDVRSLAPDMLIEYRQSYIGPSVVRHCNMLRVGDCAFDFITNRLGTVDLRLLEHPLAVHSDMLLWAPDETPENIAVMLQNVLFSVPQISVLTAEMNAEQRSVLKNHLAYFTAHRDILLHGKMTVFEPQANYSCVSAENDSLRIAALYLPRVYRFDGKRTDLFNACGENGVYIDSAVNGTAVCRDIFGKETARISFAAGAVKLPVPKGGRAELFGE